GACLQEARQSPLVAPLVVATKFMPYPWRLWKGVLLSKLRASLARLGLERVDLYQIHWPFLRPDRGVGQCAGGRRRGGIDARGGRVELQLRPDVARPLRSGETRYPAGLQPGGVSPAQSARRA